MTYAIEYYNASVDIWYVWDTTNSLYDAGLSQNVYKAKYPLKAWRVRRLYEDA
jgi:hypothetical protein